MFRLQNNAIILSKTNLVLFLHFAVVAIIGGIGWLGLDPDLLLAASGVDRVPARVLVLLNLHHGLDQLLRIGRLLACSPVHRSKRVIRLLL